MAIGYMTVEINEKGEPRIQKNQDGKEMLTFLDVEYLYTSEIHSEALEMIRASIPKEMKDVLVFFTFKYESHGSGYFTDDFEDWLVIESQLVLKENYKAFYRHQVTTELKMVGAINEESATEWGILENEKELKEAMELLVGEWEEFYDEDFKPTVIQKVAVNPLLVFEKGGGV